MSALRELDGCTCSIVCPEEIKARSHALANELLKILMNFYFFNRPLFPAHLSTLNQALFPNVYLFSPRSLFYPNDGHQYSLNKTIFFIQRTETL